MEKKKHNTRGMVYKKSAFTGQETFFPRDKILERIELILSMKEETSLDDIANMFMKKILIKNLTLILFSVKKLYVITLKKYFKIYIRKSKA